MDPDNQDTPEAGDQAGAAPGPDLSHLIDEADALEGTQAAAAAEKAAAAVADLTAANRQALRDALGMARMIAAPAMAFWPDFGTCWSDRQLDAISDAGAAVMARHDLTFGELAAQYGPYIALAGATLPPGLATYAAIKARRAELSRPAPRPPAPPSPPPMPAGATPQEGTRL
ncbi:hypothetical protein QWZ02_09360 [Kinneretia asaccharophila]|uniref:Uncharacterized protein n=1 Tax=Roseateles asaccharophilus TaxID=582607 RepID=A0A4R6N369_9BURK|nr:hypothetical protein [Roseateles asaccharophilus]MDN3544654.1 hypothetical protein [Roseateles asaccharophilus]TDP09580.1 hypothetical protein DFR39_104141 [Roseateles asaccharophilus]